MPRKVTMPIIETPRQIRLKEVTLPDPGPREVTIQVKACAICGSDVHVFKGMHPAAPLPAGAGHELSGVVAEVGKEVTRFKVGDRVCMNPMLFCGKCYYCKRAEYNHCVQVTFCYRIGQSGFAQYINRDEDWVYHLPDSLSFEEGAVIEPTSTAVHAAQSSPIQLGSRIALFGAGAIGLQTLQAAKAHGATWAAMVDVVDYRLDLARELGADVILHAAEGDPVQRIRELTGGLGVDITYECVGLEQTMRQCLAALKKGGVAMALGVFENPELKLNLQDMVNRELQIRAILAYVWDFQAALDLVAAGRIRLKPLISHTFPLSRIQEAFELLLDKRERATKILITHP
ncbi:MAG: alcohol dehydrogenase catalytic domain-containing protein [candidate division NC10 bacterium]|nr:alcohol dehydrogenase catalytic domain-containing protein [candidate division NC10 bacterium]